jgi:hypothetical protein
MSMGGDKGSWSAEGLPLSWEWVSDRAMRGLCADLLRTTGKSIIAC